MTDPTSPRYRTTFVRLLAFLRPYKRSLFVSITLAIASQAAALGAIFLTRSIVAALNAKQLNELPWLVGLVVALGVGRALALAGRRLIAGKQALYVEMDVRQAVYAKLVRLSFGFYDRHQTGQLMSRATVDLQAVRFFLGYGLIFFFQHVFTIVGVGLVVFLISWKLALIVLSIAPLLIVVAYRYSHVSHPLLRDVQQRLADVATVAQENIVGVHVVKAFAREETEQMRFKDRSEQVFVRSVQANRQRAFYIPLLGFLPLLAQAAILLVGGRMVARGSLSLGDFVAFNLFLTILVTPLRALGMWIGQAQRATASGERIFQVIDEAEDVADAPDARELPPGPGQVSFEGVTFGYEPGRPVLHDLDLELVPGRIVALIGQTGAGKTTVASLIPRFYDAQRGRVLVDGADVRDAHADVAPTGDRGDSAGRVPLLRDRPREHLVRPGRRDRRRGRAGRAARPGARVHQRLAERLRHVIGERGITLSGGQRQRIAIARALVDRSAHPDPRRRDGIGRRDHRSRIREGLREAMRNRTTIIIAHRLSTIALADEVVVLDEGRVVARGTHAELAETDRLYREIRATDCSTAFSGEEVA